jgi:hypothetical protein
LIFWFCLPKNGRDWGLVANEALQAGCGVVVSSAVGCSIDFKNLDRFAVFEEIMK